MFADQDHEHQEEQFGAGDIYLPDLADLQAQGITTEELQVVYLESSLPGNCLTASSHKAENSSYFPLQCKSGCIKACRSFFVSMAQ